MRVHEESWTVEDSYPHMDTFPQKVASVKSILLVITKHISTVDYAAPLLWKIRQKYPDVNLTVLYCAVDRRRILRESRFYGELFCNSNIQEYDFGDFLPRPFSHPLKLWRKVCSVPDFDFLPFGWLGWLRLGQMTKRLAMALKRRLERYLMNQVDPGAVLARVDPDVIMLDHRTPGSRHSWPKQFGDYFTRAGKRVILLPHGPHHTSPTTFTPFVESGDPLPHYCEYWMPFIYDRCWEAVPEKRSQFAYVGYPGLDTEWLSRCTKSNDHLGPGAGRLKCLFIIRKFLGPGESRPKGHDPFIFDHAEFSYYLDLIARAFQQTPADVEVIIKPHPSNNHQIVRKTFSKWPVTHWRIGSDSIYGLLPECDFVISLYSTTLLMPAMIEVPVVLLGSRIQSEIHRWPDMRRLYDGLEYYLEDPEELASRLPEIVEKARQRRVGDAAPGRDIQHIRHFYPDGSLQRCLERLGL